MTSFEECNNPNDLEQMGAILTDSFPNCSGYVNAVIQCQSSNQVQIARVVCRDFHVRLRWCVLGSLCPVEANSLEACWGEVPSLKVIYSKIQFSAASCLELKSLKSESVEKKYSFSMPKGV